MGIDVEIQFIRAKLSWNFNVTKIPELGFLMIWLFCTAVVTITAEKEGPLLSTSWFCEKIWSCAKFYALDNPYYGNLIQLKAFVQDKDPPCKKLLVPDYGVYVDETGIHDSFAAVNLYVGLFFIWLKIKYRHLWIWWGDH